MAPRGPPIPEFPPWQNAALPTPERGWNVCLARAAAPNRAQEQSEAAISKEAGEVAKEAIKAAIIVGETDAHRIAAIEKLLADARPGQLGHLGRTQLGPR
jgi:hypothetical protein